MLRQTIAEIYNGINMEDIIVVVPEEGIFLLTHAILEPGDHVVCTFPAYQSLYEVAQSIGCKISKWSGPQRLLFYPEPYCMNLKIIGFCILKASKCYFFIISIYYLCI